MVYTSFAPSLSSRDAAPFDALVASECHRLAASLRFQSMTSRDTGLSGSIDRSNTASESNFIEPQDPTNNTAMSATTVYPATFYPPPATFNHTPSNPAHVYRRPSQPAAPIYSNQCATVPTASSFDASGHQIESESAPRNSALTQPVPTMSRYQSGAAQAPLTLRPNLAAPITHVLSQPHPRISTFSNSAPLIDPAIHLDIVRYPVTELVAMLAAKLQSLITTNDQLKRLSSSSSSSSSPRPASSSQNKQDTRLLSFHARNIPSITITAYLNRILKYCPTDPEVFISVLVYFDRIMQIANSRAEPIFGSYFAPFQVLPGRPLVHSSLPPPAHNDDTFTIDSFNVHRLVITTIAVATKFFSDQFYTNSRYARVGGLPLVELNHLEIQFLILNDFTLMIPPAEIQFYADHLLRFWIMEQQRQVDNSFVRIVNQSPADLEYKSPVTPITPAPFFSSAPNSSSSSTTLYQPQYASQPMDDVRPTHNTYSHEPIQNQQ